MSFFMVVNMPASKPKIAIMLDENTSAGGTSYQISKNYFKAITYAGGIPYGIPYCPDFIETASSEFDAFFSTGAGTALPLEWYMKGHSSLYPQSERTQIEIAIMKSFLKADKPVLGSCNGMQVLAGIYDCKIRSDLGDSHRTNHTVQVQPETSFSALVKTIELTVNSRHSEAVANPTKHVKIAALSNDGIIEAIEIPEKRFAFGLQWHQEDFWDQDHPANVIFKSFITASSMAF